MEKYYYNRNTGVPMRRSAFAVFLNFVLLLTYKTVKMVSMTAQRIFQSGIDNKIIIKK